MSARDDSELLDLCDRDGSLLGRTKARWRVHQDGDWHRTIHIWVWTYDHDHCPALVFQRRALGKDTWPGAIDVAVSGHLRAGETFEEALREAEEEIGLRVDMSDLVQLGRRRHCVATGREHRDNELQTIFATRAPVSLKGLRPFTDEVSAVLVLPHAAAGELFRREIDAAWATRHVTDADSADLLQAPLTAQSFVAAPDGYYLRAHASIAEVMAGSAPKAWELSDG